MQRIKNTNKHYKMQQFDLSNKHGWKKSKIKKTNPLFLTRPKIKTIKSNKIQLKSQN